MARVVVLLFCFIASTLTFTHSVTVFSEDSETPLTVEPLYPENQEKNTKGYFKLHVQPNMQQTVKVSVTNNLNEEQTVLMKPANGFTNPVGGMLYSEDIESDDSILLKDAVKLAPNLKVESEITLKPKETKEISIDILVPNIDKGTVLGGVRFITEGTASEESLDANEGEANFVLNTETVYAIAIQLDFPTPTTPNFSLGKTRFNLEGPSVTIEMVNDSQMIQENISGTYYVENAEGNKLFEGEIPPFKMAPKSQIRYPILWNFETLEQGDYKLYANIKVKDKDVVAEEPFSIGDKEVNEYVEKTQPIVPQGKTENYIPTWVWYICGAIVLSGVMFWIGGRRKKR